MSEEKFTSLSNHYRNLYSNTESFDVMCTSLILRNLSERQEFVELGQQVKEIIPLL